ncbi:acyl-CoA dehydrogenase family protein [Actinokineospora guangxiensis]|uniref:Acyl-CoA dehydrogenase family protein n=1 Tax=Actinokineospora guangxiensis TaxID=1490288 RepID=A0ABW0EKM4_9PSEU
MSAPATTPVALPARATALVDALRADAATWESTGVPDGVIADLAAAGLLGADIPTAHGGSGADPAGFGEVCARVGRVCGSLRALLTVQGMVAAAVLRWGDADQRARWLPALAAGDAVAGFAATEAGAGTDLSAVATRVGAVSGDVAVSGHKRWITFGERADVFLVLGTGTGGHTAVLVEADRAGVSRTPVSGQLGLRGARLADVRFDAVRVPAANVLAAPGFGLSHVAAVALDHGRHSVAWGCAGLAEACVDEAAAHAATRVQGDTALAEHQLVRAALGRMAVDAAAARGLCERAARLRACGDPGSVVAAIAAKHGASRAAATVAREAVRLLGAAGCAPGSAVGRHARDAAVFEIIEGSAHVAELHVGDDLLARHGFRAGRRP